MRKYSFLLLLAMVLGFAQGIRADEPFRKHRYDSWKVLGLPQDAIVFVGNSITDMHNWTEAFGNDARVVNRGNSGGYSYEVLENVESWVRFKPAKVFIKIGTNDLGTNYTEQSIAQNIRKTVDIIRRESPSTEIYLQSIIPAKDQAYKTLATIQAANVLIKGIADATDHTTYIDLYSKMSGVLSGQPYSLDNLHLMAYGYKIWTEAIRDYVGIAPIYPENTQSIQNAATLTGSHGMRATYFSVQPVTTRDILFFGDEMVKNGEWQELLHNQNVKNRGSYWGYGGDISVTSNFVDAAFANKSNGVTREIPAKMLLYTGTSDVNGSTDLSTIENNYAAVIAKMKAYAPGCPIALVSLMPTQNANSRITSFNAWLESTASADDDLTYIDIYSVLAQSSGAARTEYFSGNYIYGMGYLQVARKLAGFIGDCTVISDAEAQTMKDAFEARTTLNTAIHAVSDLSTGTGIGQYPESSVAGAAAKAEAAKALLANTGASLNDLQSAATEISAAMTALKAQINTPTAENVAGRQFALSTPNRMGLYAYTDGTTLNSTSSNPGYAKYRWTFVSRGDGTFDIRNVANNTYMNPAAAHNTQIQMSATAPSAGWSIQYADAQGLYIISSGTNCQLNSTDKSGNPIFNWYGTFPNRTDAGCQWKIEDVTDEKLVEPIVVVTGNAQEGAATIQAGHIYTITNHQQNGTCYPLYADETSKTLSVGEANALAAKSYGNRAKFEAIAKGSKFAFRNVETGQYLIWKGNNEGYNGNAGLLDVYNSTYCDLAITSVTNVTNGKLITGKRSNGTDNGTFVQNTDGTWNKWRDATVGYTATYSNIYTFGDVTEGTDGETEPEPTPEPEGDTWEAGIDWYTMQIGAAGLYISNNGTASSISLNRTKTEFADADLWMRTGNDTDGYTLYNKEAGPGKVLAAPTTMSGTNGGSSFPILVDKTNVPTGYTTKWLFAASTSLGADVEAWYMYEKGYPNNKVNNRNGVFAFWSTGADGGSSIQWTWAQKTLAVNMSTGGFTAKNANGSWAQVWQSTSTQPTLKLNAGYNNMSVANSNATQIQAYRGSYEPQTYTLGTVENGYYVKDYSFDFVSSSATAITVRDAKGKTYTSSATKQTISCEGLEEGEAQFTLSGSNNGINITNFLVTINVAVAPELGVRVFDNDASTVPYRIPAVARNQQGDLLFVTDYRYSKADIGMATNGKLDLRIRTLSKDSVWSDVSTLAACITTGNFTAFGDPCIVADRTSNRVMVTSCCGNVSFPNGTHDNHQGWARCYSEDGGKTWGQHTDISQQVFDQLDKRSDGPIRSFFIGSGKISQSQRVKVGDYYRIYCAALVKTGDGTNCNYVLYSDDFGLNWNVLGDPDDCPIPSGGDEPKADELPDGSILISSRVSGGRYYNVYHFTDTQSGKGNWGSMTFSGSGNAGVKAEGNSCNGEIIVLPVLRKADNQKTYLLLQSVPFGSGRANVGIYYKDLDNLTKYRTGADLAPDWTGKFQVTRKDAAYSTMCLDQDNNLAFFYEETGYNGGYNMIYRKLSVEEITGGRYQYAELTEAERQAYLSAGITPYVESLGISDDKIVGMPSKAEVEEAAQAYRSNVTTATYEAFNDAMVNSGTKLDQTGTAMYYLKNAGRSTASTTYVMTYASGKFKGASSTAAPNNENSWIQFIPVEGQEDTYYIYNAKAGKYFGRLGANETESTPVSDKAQAGTFQIDVKGMGQVGLMNTNKTGSNSYIHLAGDLTRLVPWSASEASLWYLVEAVEGIETYTRPLSNEWGTLCLPRTVEADAYDNTSTTFYTITDIERDGQGNPTALGLSQTTGSLPAGQPSIFHCTADALTCTMSGARVQQGGTVNGMTGVLEPSEEANAAIVGKYLLSGGKFVKCATGSTIAANRAYIDMSAVGTSAVKADLYITLDGSLADGILLPDAQQQYEFYSVSGVRVAHPTKGLYITQGKKVVLK